MSSTVNDRLNALRKEMAREGLSAFIFPSTDPHNGEYVPEHWEGRKWISGFTGSAGTAVVTQTSAALWTDSRYFIAAAEELRDTEYQLMKMGMAGTPSIAEWLANELHSMEESDGAKSYFKASRGHEIGLDGMVNTASTAIQLEAEMRKRGGINVRFNYDPLRLIWHDRPAIPLNKVMIHPLEYCGTTAREKLSRIRRELLLKGADGMLMSSLDDIAWTLNLRGSDVHCNPVFVSYLLIDGEDTTLFINQQKLTPEVKAYLQAEGVATDDYEKVKEGLAGYGSYSILLDPSETCYTLFRAHKIKKVIEEASPVPALKAVKTEAEIAGFRRAMVRDGVALVRFQRHLMEHITEYSEVRIAEKLHALRAEQPLFVGDSFDTIAGYGPHGAIVHYEATPETDVPLEPHGFVLIDSGAQYLDGTTDITRTIPLGPLSDEERLVYTLVLKGHIQLEMLHFPDGASGTQLDAVARMDLWKHGYNFLHGTGHGVGSYLCVHEGPHQIRMEYRPAPLHSMMTVTDEPGIYVEGKFGIRIENTLVTQPAGETPFGRFLRFDSLTLCPIDTAPIMTELLSDEEREWLNKYHERVYNELAPLLSPDDAEWLKEVTAKI